MSSAPADTDPPDPAPAVPDSRLPKGKLGLLAAFLKRPDSASIEDMMEATGWQAHSVRGAMSGGLKKKLVLIIESEKTGVGRIYRLWDMNCRQVASTFPRPALFAGLRAPIPCSLFDTGYFPAVRRNFPTPISEISITRSRNN